MSRTPKNNNANGEGVDGVSSGNDIDGAGTGNTAQKPGASPHPQQRYHHSAGSWS